MTVQPQILFGICNHSEILLGKVSFHNSLVEFTLESNIILKFPIGKKYRDNSILLVQVLFCDGHVGPKKRMIKKIHKILERKNKPLLS